MLRACRLLQYGFLLYVTIWFLILTMVAGLDSDSPATSCVDTNTGRPIVEAQQNASPAKRRRLENLVQDLAAASVSTGKIHGEAAKSEHDIRPGDVTGFNHDIFNTDNDRQKLIDVCEKMLEECKHPAQEEAPTPKGPTEVDEKALKDQLALLDEWDNLGDFDLDTSRGAFDHDDSAFGDQQLKSAYYFDGERFVSIQVIIDGNSGECQLILPMDHPHYLGVPEEVPIFETKSVPVKDLKS